jgi:hypothetical protein
MGIYRLGAPSDATTVTVRGGKISIPKSSQETTWHASQAWNSRARRLPSKSKNRWIETASYAPHRAEDSLQDARAEMSKFPSKDISPREMRQ